jgi:hypothetical protein
MYFSPLGPMFNDPFLTLTPPPHEELAAEESVTMELAEAVSISARVTRWSLYSCSQLLPLPVLRFQVQVGHVERTDAHTITHQEYYVFSFFVFVELKFYCVCSSFKRIKKGSAKSK